jgi:hypothetical protein
MRKSTQALCVFTRAATLACNVSLANSSSEKSISVTLSEKSGSRAIDINSKVVSTFLFCTAACTGLRRLETGSQYSANTLPILCQYSANTLPILCQYSANTLPILRQYSANTLLHNPALSAILLFEMSNNVVDIREHHRMPHAENHLPPGAGGVDLLSQRDSTRGNGLVWENCSSWFGEDHEEIYQKLGVPCTAREDALCDCRQVS